MTLVRDVRGAMLPSVYCATLLPPVIPRPVKMRFYCFCSPLGWSQHSAQSGLSASLMAMLMLLATGSGLSTAAVSERLPGPRFDDLGDLHHPITTSSKEAQRYFDQGLRLLFGFNHKEAIRSFRSAAVLDPMCAMAHWGAAYACGPHVNKPMDAEDTASAWTALQLAVARKASASTQEQAYIAALERRYQPAHREDRSALDRSFAEAMRELTREYPDDLDAQTLFAESLMNTMPWDYWTRDRAPKPETEEVLAALRFVLSRDPDHPGANHFYIHAVEAGPAPEVGLPSADRLLRYAPGAGHLVHMPAHIYMRVGQYRDAAVANEWAARADRSYLRHCRAQGFYPGVYYPHNLHFLWWAQVFEGRSRDSLRSAHQAADYALDNLCGPKKVLEAPRLRHLPWLTLARFGRWEELLRIPEPRATNDFLIDRALWHFTRGLAFAALGDSEACERARKELSLLAGSPEAKALNSPMFPATEVLGVAQHWLEGKAAGLRGARPGLIAHLEKAVAAEDAIPYMEPSFWPLPVRPALGAALLKLGEARRAEAVFRQDLQRWPRNGWSLFGLEASLRQQGKQTAADDVHRQFVEAWKHADVQPDLTWY